MARRTNYAFERNAKAAAKAAKREAKKEARAAARAEKLRDTTEDGPEGETTENQDSVDQEIVDVKS
jgi:hypothetical protein